MRFTKMQGLGNDYLYVFGDVPENAPEISRRLSDRRFGAGSDGMIYISGSSTADFSMRIFNADGSEAEMCGNGIRCVGKYVYDKGYTDRKTLTVETLSGIKKLSLDVRRGKVRSVSVEMGQAETADDVTVAVGGKRLVCTPVSVGNPHAVFFTENAETVPLEEIGPVIEYAPVFGRRVNVEFASVMPGNTVRMRVWERGSGITMACGTGACAAAAAAVKKKLCSADVPVTVVLDGGKLIVTVSRDGRITMTGPAETVYEGETEI